SPEHGPKGGLPCCRGPDTSARLARPRSPSETACLPASSRPGQAPPARPRTRRPAARRSRSPSGFQWYELPVRQGSSSCSLLLIGLVLIRGLIPRSVLGPCLDSIELVGPKRFKGSHPVVNRFESFSIYLVEPPLARAADHDKSHFSEHPQVLGDL